MSENPHYAERSDDETTPQTGGGVGDVPAGGGGDDEPEVGGISDGPGSHGEEPEHGHAGHAQFKGTAMSGVDQPHPAGDPRSTRDVGGPKAADDAPAIGPGEADELPGAAKGDIRTKGMEPHE